MTAKQQAGSDCGAHTGAPDADYRKVARWGLAAVLLGLGGFLVWAVLAPMDEGVPANGVISVESKRKRIDHLHGGIVERVHVREGQRVNAGDTLVTLNEAQARAALNAAESQWRTAAITRARLDAERTGATRITLPQALAGAGGEAQLAALLHAQEDLARSRRNALQGELAIVRESIRGLENQIRSLDELVAGRTKQIRLYEEQLAAFRKLHERQFVSRVQLIDIEKQMTEAQTRQSEDLANIAGVKARLSELRMRGVQRELEYRREVETQQAEVDKELAQARERTASARDVLERLVVRAPAAGTVVDLALHTVGGVIKPGDKLMEIVPDGDELIVEAQVQPQYVDRVRAGLDADVHFDAYINRVRQPVITGHIKTISADALTDTRTGLAYYTARVAVPGTQLAQLGAFSVRPGMQTTLMIKTGERTLMAYLMRPLYRRVATAMGES